MLLAVGLLAVHAAVLDEAAGSAVLELDDVAPAFATVRARVVATMGRRGNCSPVACAAGHACMS